ncbi:hypothetical protein BDV97DRAFT_423550 [Delphinella strobiligena]|nr:hypothetical protein BDV97DRAFT_423550 [Delphinella strobiligena]
MSTTWLHATVYKFNKAGRKEIIAQFEQVLPYLAHNMAQTNTYPIFEVECPIEYGITPYTTFTHICNKYIDENLNGEAERTVFPLDGSRAPDDFDSVDYENLLVDDSANLLIDTAVDEDDEEAAGHVWYPAHGGTDLRRVFTDSIIDAIAQDTHCPLALDTVKRQITINGAKVHEAARKLSNIERNSCRSKIATHIVHVEKMLDVRLQLKPLMEQPHGMLRRTLIPILHEALVENLPRIRTCRVTRWDTFKSQHEMIFNAPQRLEAPHSELLRIWISLNFPVVSSRRVETICGDMGLPGKSHIEEVLAPPVRARKSRFDVPPSDVVAPVAVSPQPLLPHSQVQTSLSPRVPPGLEPLNESRREQAPSFYAAATGSSLNQKHNDISKWAESVAPTAPVQNDNLLIELLEDPSPSMGPSSFVSPPGFSGDPAIESTQQAVYSAGSVCGLHSLDTRSITGRSDFSGISALNMRGRSLEAQLIGRSSVRRLPTGRSTTSRQLENPLRYEQTLFEPNQGWENNIVKPNATYPPLIEDVEPVFIGHQDTNPFPPLGHNGTPLPKIVPTTRKAVDVLVEIGSEDAELISSTQNQSVPTEPPPVASLEQGVPASVPKSPLAVSGNQIVPRFSWSAEPQKLPAVSHNVPGQASTTQLPYTRIVQAQNLPLDVTENEVHDFFKRIGPVHNINIPSNLAGPRKNHIKGTAFITYLHPDDAREAMRELNGLSFMGWPMPLNLTLQPTSLATSATTSTSPQSVACDLTDGHVLGPPSSFLGMPMPTTIPADTGAPAKVTPDVNDNEDLMTWEDAYDLPTRDTSRTAIYTIACAPALKDLLSDDGIKCENPVQPMSPSMPEVQSYHAVPNHPSLLDTIFPSSAEDMECSPVQFMHPILPVTDLPQQAPQSSDMSANFQAQVEDDFERIQQVIEYETRRFHRTMKQQKPSKKPRTKTKKTQDVDTSGLPLPELLPLTVKMTSKTAPLITTQDPPKIKVRLPKQIKQVPVLNEGSTGGIITILEHARAFRGELDMEIQLGQVLYHRTKNGEPRSFMEKTMEKQVFEEGMTAHHAADDVEVVFSPRLTTEICDACHIVVDHLFETKPYQEETFYEIALHDRDDKEFHLRVSSNGVKAVAPSEEVGSEYHEFPKRVWDARFLVTGRGRWEPPEHVELFISSIETTVPTREFQGEQFPMPEVRFRVESNDIKVQAVVMKRVLHHRSCESDAFTLQVAEVRDCVLRCRQSPCQSYIEYYAVTGFPPVLIKEQALWFEASIHIAPSPLFNQNKEIQVGEDSEWRPRDVLSERLHADLMETLEQLITRMDGVGFDNQGPRGSAQDLQWMAAWEREVRDLDSGIYQPFW